MKLLAARRRHPMALVVLLLVGLLLTGGAYSLFTGSTTASADEYSAADVEAGQKLFVTNCATCHGLNAEGSENGPSLIGVGAAAVDFQVSTGRMPLQMHGPQAQVKQAQFSEEEIAQMAGYVASLGPGPAVPDEEWLDTAEGDAAAGGGLFRTNCAMCHNAVGAGGALSEGKYAPSLFASTPTEIYEAMLTGPQSMPVFNDANITPEAKRDVIAYLMEQRGEQAAVGGANLGAVGPVSEGLWVWVIGMGALVAAAVWIGAKSS